ncbi:MAG TPA: hypothetical protein ENI63_00740 [Candidatus Kaiserbacteria bacterium]|nr:hypothetical protein [Candidatus Kaiserbacteria bacterium]
MEKIIKSRTVWTIALVAIMGAWQAISPFLDPSLFTVVNTVLLGVAGYFRINPKAGFSNE